ncbi:MAG: acyl-CoA synthetase [Sphingomonadales bacterium]
MYTNGFMIRSLADVAEIERVSCTERLRHDSTYEALRAAASKWPEKTALHFLPTGSASDEPVSYSYRELIEKITQAANLFHDLGVGPSDVISLLLPILPQTEFALWGAEAAGIANPLNPFLETGQLIALMDAAGTSVLVTTGPDAGDGAWEKVAAARDHLPGLKAVVVIGGATDIPGTVRFETALANYPGDHLVSGRTIEGDDIAAYFHTGGTTGLPKLAKHTHRAEVLQAWNTAAMMGVEHDGVNLMGLPFFHVGNAVITSLRGLMVGETLVLLSPSGFRNPTVIRDYWRIVERFGATMIGGVPTALAAVMDVPLGDTDISSIRSGFTGGAATPVALLHQIKNSIGTEIVEGWGMTETSSYATLNPRNGEIRFGSAGFHVPYHRVKAVELDGDGRFKRECAAGEIGIIAVSGPGLFAGYVEDPHNRGVFIDDVPGGGRWFNSGDLGRHDEDGYLWLTGRAKDVIIRGAHNIDPQVIEETLNRHPAVHIVAAVGMADRRAGELPVAYVQLTPGAEVDAEELQVFARAHIPERAAAPVFVEIRDVLPLTGVGKIFKPRLRWDAAQRAFEAALAPLRDDGVALSVSVGPDDHRGELATVTVEKTDPDHRTDVERRIKAELSRFTLHHAVRWL